ncbi:FAD-dependent tricarballylate dehydrogenase TcuA [Granulicella aggregans]|uniref:FAD-dependent tricarballylate dehydrogenase TcuA n=1 Tax=Granulicella aggregans TaxID=474949 RepID=UPI0021E088C6|nr:FAD-dependent tricarballylate dehydrogenase TcuA [Granulicella aggregans]
MDDLSGFDVLVVGGGNAGLAAALSAREGGAKVLLLESAPQWFRAGNSRHTRDLRCMHDAPTKVMSGAYTEDEFYKDVLSVTQGKTNEHLARMTIRASTECTEWMGSYGVRFQKALGGTLQLGRTNAFFLGGGKAMMNAYYDAAYRVGVRVVYNAEVVALRVVDGEFQSLTALIDGKSTTVVATAVVVSSGGFESNLEWLKEAWGPMADNFLIRGTPYNKGKVLKCLLDLGMESISDAREGHMVAIDGRSPKFDGGIVTRLDCVSLGIVVNNKGERFYDEGEDFWPKRYAIWGRLVAEQPDQVGYCFIDSKAMGKFMPTLFPPFKAETIGELAQALKLPAEQVVETIKAYNDAVQPGTFDHETLDDCKTTGLKPAKTHWALKIDQPPFYAYPLRPGITFTYLGLMVNDRATVLMKGGTRSKNIFAAGEIMAGNVLGMGYAAGIGVTIGTVFGRIAGREAAMQALNPQAASLATPEVAIHAVR